MVAGLRQESHDEEMRVVAREAFDVLDPVEDPLTHLYLLRVLCLLGELSLPGDVRDVLPVPLAAIRDQRGVREAASVFAEALTLAEEARRPDLEFQLIEAADRELPELPGDSYRRRRWASEVHCLAGDRLRCSPGPIPVAEAAGRLRTVADRDGWSAEQRAATFIHLAAHAPGTARAHRPHPHGGGAGAGSAAVRPGCRAALDHLDGTLSYDMGLYTSVTGQEAVAAGHFADAVAAYAACGQTDMALNSLDAGLRGALAADGGAPTRPWRH